MPTADDITRQRADYKSLRAKALKITDTALAEGRTLTDEEAQELDATVRQAKSIHAELEQHQQAQSGVSLESIKALAEMDQKSMEDRAARRAYGLPVYDGPTMGRKDAEAPHPWATAIEESARAHGAKAFGMPSGSVPLVSLSTVPVSLGQIGMALVEAIGLTPWPATGGRTVQYLRQTTRVNRAAIWQPGTATDGSDSFIKPISDLGTTLVEANAEVIAHLASPVRRNDLADFDQLNQWVAGELQYGLGQALEGAILSAAGPEPDMTGLLVLGGATPIPWVTGSDVPTQLMAAQVALADLGYGEGLTAVFNPSDWAAVALMKSTTGEYLFPTLPAAAAAPSLLGIRAITTPRMPVGECIVAKLRAAVQLFEREAPVVEWGIVNDQFERNLLTARCEGRFALTVGQPAAIAIVAIAATHAAVAPKAAKS
jgi:Phage capsid family